MIKITLLSITRKHKTSAYEIKEHQNEKTVHSVTNKAYCTGKNKTQSSIKTDEVSPSLEWVQFCDDPAGIFCSGLIQSSKTMNRIN